MTRTEAIKEFFKKAVLPVAIAGLLYCIFKSACIRNGELDLLWLWILCGLPFGIHRMCVWIVPGGGAARAALLRLKLHISLHRGLFVLSAQSGAVYSPSRLSSLSQFYIMGNLLH